MSQAPRKPTPPPGYPTGWPSFPFFADDSLPNLEKQYEFYYNAYGHRDLADIPPRIQARLTYLTRALNYEWDKGTQATLFG